MVPKVERDGGHEVQLDDDAYAETLDRIFEVDHDIRLVSDLSQGILRCFTYSAREQHDSAQHNDDQEQEEQRKAKTIRHRMMMIKAGRLRIKIRMRMRTRTGTRINYQVVRG